MIDIPVELITDYLAITLNYKYTRILLVPLQNVSCEEGQRCSVQVTDGIPKGVCMSKLIQLKLESIQMTVKDQFFNT